MLFLVSKQFMMLLLYKKNKKMKKIFRFLLSRSMVEKIFLSRLVFVLIASAFFGYKISLPFEIYITQILIFLRLAEILKIIKNKR